MIEQLNIRRLTEEKEESLSVNAARSGQSRGRLTSEEPCPIRTAFQRDRDRIVYSNAFRRLKHKTQVFINPRGDHYVTRLTHTLEVSQIARTIARALNLNEDLAEAIAMGHDLGHTPFGHVGEDVLDELYPPGFRHNEQSLRIVDLLEKDGRGLNLTWEVRDGIVKHSKSGVDVLGENWGEVSTLEGETVKISDLVAWINHDIDDAVRAGIIGESNLPQSAIAVLGNSHQERVNKMVSDILIQSWSVRTGDADCPGIAMGPEVLEAANALREFLFEKVYNMNAARKETSRAREMLGQLYTYFNDNEDKLPPEYRLSGDETARRVVDYIAGMTDQFATRLAGELK
ncbi:MAG: deoxyguanosinetriphosphate triphosphohydrolase [Dehalococcoidales bacterium]